MKNLDEYGGSPWFLVHEGGGSQKGFGVNFKSFGWGFYDMSLIMFNSFSSPFMCVFGDDGITCYTEANDVSGGASNA